MNLLQNRKTIYFALLFSVVYLQLRGHIMESAKQQDLIILTQDNKPTAALQKLLDLENIKATDLKGLVKDTQEEWLRKPGTERWHLPEKENIGYQDYLKLFNELGMVAEHKPMRKNYHYALILGATCGTMQNRFMELIKLWNSGIRFDEIVFLVGQRDRDISIETDEILYNPKAFIVKDGWQKPTEAPKTEYDLAKLIVDQTALPKDMTLIKITFVNTPKQKNADGSIRRPNTGDTFKEWLKSNPQIGKCLVISNNPYIGYQHSVAQTFLPKEFEVDTVGCKSNDGEKIANYLDTLARWIYQENIRLNSHV